MQKALHEHGSTRAAGGPLPGLRLSTASYSDKLARWRATLHASRFQMCLCLCCCLCSCLCRRRALGLASWQEAGRWGTVLDQAVGPRSSHAASRENLHHCDTRLCFCFCFCLFFYSWSCARSVVFLRWQLPRHVLCDMMDGGGCRAFSLPMGALFARPSCLPCRVCQSLTADGSKVHTVSCQVVPEIEARAADMSLVSLGETFVLLLLLVGRKEKR